MEVLLPKARLEYHSRELSTNIMQDQFEHNMANENSDVKNKADPISEEFRLEYSPFYRLTQVESAYRQKMEGILKSVGMDLPRWRVLMILREKSPSTVSEIANRAAMKLSTMTKVTQRLEKEGYVSLSRSKQDARSTDVSSTEKGEEAVVRIRQVASKIYRQATQDLTAEDIRRLNSTLRTLEDSLQ